MPTAVVILPTTTYRASDFVRAAESIGVDLVVVSEHPSPIDMGDRYLQIACSDPVSAAEAIAALGETRPIDGVVAADDQGVMVAAHASRLLGLRGNPPEAAAATRDKLAMRRLLERAEVDQPAFVELAPGIGPSEVADPLGFPVVVKPVDRTASQGVIRADDLPGLEAGVARVRGIVGGEASLLLESFAPGVEVAIEGMVEDGELTVLALFDKPDTPDGPFFPETIFVTPSRLSTDAQAEAVRVASAAVSGLGLTHGPAHIELKVEGGRARVVEVAARSIGGLCSRSLNFGLMGTTLETLILRNALGLRANLRREPLASGVLMIPTPETGTLVRVAGEEEVRAIGGITGIDITIPPGGEVVAPPEGDRYVGFVYARGEKPDQVENALRKAMAILEVQLEG